MPPFWHLPAPDGPLELGAVSTVDCGPHLKYWLGGVGRVTPWPRPLLSCEPVPTPGLWVPLGFGSLCIALRPMALRRIQVPPMAPTGATLVG